MDKQKDLYKNISEQRKESITRRFKVPIISRFFPRRCMDSYLKMLFTRCGYQTFRAPLGVVCGEKMSTEAIVPGK
jgi:hypothetical protein